MVTTIAQTPSTVDYVKATKQYEEKTDKKLQNADTLVLSGFGVSLKIERDALHIKNGRSYAEQTIEPCTLYRGVHGIKQIVILTNKGSVSLDVIAWCKEQDITITMLDYSGNLVQSLTPEQESNAKLRRAQYTMDEKKVGYIACEIVKEKLYQQKATLEKHSELPQGERAQEIFTDTLKWFELPELPERYYEVDFLRLVEGRAAKAYFESWVGLPLKWGKSDAKTLPPHWLTVTERTSPLSNGNGRKAVNPGQCILNYAYALLESACRQALQKEGFDLSCGILHTDKNNRDSLVYDLMELYRGKIDHLVLSLLKTLSFKKGMVIPVTDGSMKLNPELARYICSVCQIASLEIEDGAKTLKQLILS
jgi:CRISPR-associated endonuclease Cas1